MGNSGCGPAIWSGAGPTAAMDGEWHFTVAPYMWFSGIKGDVSVGNLPSIPVDAPISDILSNFDFGLQGHFQALQYTPGRYVASHYTGADHVQAPGPEVHTLAPDLEPLHQPEHAPQSAGGVTADQACDPDDLFIDVDGGDAQGAEEIALAAFIHTDAWTQRLRLQHILIAKLKLLYFHI